jgi:hypothetical protein
MNRSLHHLILSDAVELIASRAQRGRLLYPILFFVLNLLVCAAFERQLRIDTTATSLGYFFLLEFGLYGASLLAQYQRLIFPVLEKSTVFPMSSLTTLLFCVWSDVRSPITVVFLITNILLLGTVYHISLSLVLLAVVIYLLLFISVETIFVLFALVLQRNRNPETILLISFAVLLLVAFVVAEFFGGGPVVSFLPITSWAARGIVAARSADLGMVMLSIFLLLAAASINVIASTTLQKRIRKK